MGVEAKHDSLCINRVLRSSIRISYRCASEHWVLISLVLLLNLLYKSSPGFFAFVLSSSPVIICATLLLGVLLSYGSANLPEVNENGKTPADISAPKFGSFSRNIHFEAYQGFSVPAFKENTISFRDWEIKNTSFGKARTNRHVELDGCVPLPMLVDQGDERVDARDRLEEELTSILSMVTLHQEVGTEEFMKDNQVQESKDPFSSKDKGNKYADLCEDVHQSRVDGKETTFGLCSSSENDREDGEMVAKANRDRVLTDSQSDEVREVSEGKPAEKPAGACRWGRAFSVRQRKKHADLKIEAINDAVENQLDSSLCSPFARAGSHDGSSGFDSDKAERSSPDASMTDIAPVLEEIDPLLGADFPSPDPIANDGSGSDSIFCPQDCQIDSDSNDESDISKAKNDGKDGEEKKDDGNEPAFLWTADDEKNVMDLGYSEVERNRRLEVLMAKRRSRKNIRFDLDRNLIDLDRNDVTGSADGFSRFHIQVQPISVPKRNPFGLPSDSDEATIPGSAPSILHPRKNPFDLPFEHSNDIGLPAHHNLDPQEFVTVSHRDVFFRRHDSFNFGSQERNLSRFKPYFVLEPMNFEEASTSNFQRQFSDNSVSKLSVVTESDTISSAADQEDHNDPIKKDILWEHASPDLPTQESDLGYVGSQCSDGINFVDDETLNAVTSGMESEPVENTST